MGSRRISDDAGQLLANANALLVGGDVIAVHGADAEIVDPYRERVPAVIAKLKQEQILIERLTALGHDVMQLDPQIRCSTTSSWSCGSRVLSSRAYRTTPSGR